MDGLTAQLRGTEDRLEDALRKQRESQTRLIELEQEISDVRNEAVEVMAHKAALEERERVFRREYNSLHDAVSRARGEIEARDTKLRKAIDCLVGQGTRIEELKAKNQRLGRAVSVLKALTAQAKMSHEVAKFLFPRLTEFELRLEAHWDEILGQFNPGSISAERIAFEQAIQQQMDRVLSERDMAEDSNRPVDLPEYWMEHLKPSEVGPGGPGGRDPPRNGLKCSHCSFQVLLPTHESEADVVPAQAAGEEQKGDDATPAETETKAEVEAEAEVAPAPPVEAGPAEAAPAPADEPSLPPVELADFDQNHEVDANAFFDNTKWLRVQRGILARLLQSLRKHFAAEQEARRTAELQCVQFEQRALFSNVSLYQEFFKVLEDLRFDTGNLFTLASQLKSLASQLKDTGVQTKSAIQDARSGASELAGQLAEARSKPAVQDSTTQVDNVDEERWDTYLEKKGDRRLKSAGSRKPMAAATELVDDENRFSRGYFEYDDTEDVSLPDAQLNELIADLYSIGVGERSGPCCHDSIAARSLIGRLLPPVQRGL